MSHSDQTTSLRALVVQNSTEQAEHGKGLLQLSPSKLLMLLESQSSGLEQELTEMGFDNAARVAWALEASGQNRNGAVKLLVRACHFPTNEPALFIRSGSRGWLVHWTIPCLMTSLKPGSLIQSMC